MADRRGKSVIFNFNNRRVSRKAAVLNCVFFNFSLLSFGDLVAVGFKGRDGTKKT